MKTKLDTLTRRLDYAVHRLLQESTERARSYRAEDTDAYVPFIDLEREAQQRLAMSHGWQKEFETQTNFKEGTVKRWNTNGRAPKGALLLCGLLSPIKAKQIKTRWGEDEKTELRRLWNIENIHNYAALGDAMHRKFGDRRNYLDEGPMAGAIRRYLLGRT